jgi:hypothetical protein
MFAIITECQFANQRGKVKAGEERKRTIATRAIVGIVPLAVVQDRDWPVPNEESDDLFYQYEKIESSESVQDLDNMLNMRKQAAKIEALANANLSDEDLKGIVQDTGLLSLVLKRRIEKRAGKTAVVAQRDDDDRSNDADFLDDEDAQRDADAAEAANSGPVQTDDVFA